MGNLYCYGRIHSFLFHFWFGQWKASLRLSVMFLAAMECQALRWIMKALIETYSGPGICKSRGNVQTEWWLSFWIYYSREKKHMSPTINNNRGSSRNTNREWKLSKATKCPSPCARQFIEQRLRARLRWMKESQWRAKLNNLYFIQNMKENFHW